MSLKDQGVQREVEGVSTRLDLKTEADCKPETGSKCGFIFM